MNVRRESKAEHYDVVVVGSGIGGLSAAALLAHRGRDVLVVEQHDRPGGFTHGFQRKRYSFDSAIHTTSGCEPVDFGTGAVIDDVLRTLGVRDEIEFHRVDPVFAAIYPGLQFEAPSGTQNFVTAFARHFPAEERGIRQLLRLCTRFNREIKRLPPDATPAVVADRPEEFPLLHRYGLKTVDEVMTEFIRDERLKTMLATQWGYLGLPPSRVAFTRFSTMLLSYVHAGAYYCAGGFAQIPDLLVRSLHNDGGELLSRTGVRRILADDGRVRGIQLHNGQRITADTVISNADATMTFEELLGVEHVPVEYVRALRGMRRSLSAVTAYFATDVDLHTVAGLRHETFVFTTWDQDAAFAACAAGDPAAFTVSAPTLVDASLAPPGEHLFTVTSLASFEAEPSWRLAKDSVLERLQRAVEDAFPILRGRITFAEAGTPRTMERYTSSTKGSIYGWEATPDQSGVHRLPRRTPVEGLYLSSAWTQPGGGLVPGFVSGLETAALVLGTGDVASLLHPEPALSSA